MFLLLFCFKKYLRQYLLTHFQMFGGNLENQGTSITVLSFLFAYLQIPTAIVV